MLAGRGGWEEIEREREKEKIQKCKQKEIRERKKLNLFFFFFFNVDSLFFPSLFVRGHCIFIFFCFLQA